MEWSLMRGCLLQLKQTDFSRRQDKGEEGGGSLNIDIVLFTLYWTIAISCIIWGEKSIDLMNLKCFKGETLMEMFNYFEWPLVTYLMLGNTGFGMTNDLLRQWSWKRRTMGWFLLNFLHCIMIEGSAFNLLVSASGDYFHRLAA